MRKIYNIPSDCSFLDVLAEAFLNDYKDDPLGLSDVLFLLPNRRSCQTLAEAFVRCQGLAPTMLPQMRPLADISEDELLLTGFDLSQVLKTMPPSMSSMERQMLFTKIIMSKPADYGLEKMPAGQAASLAKELSALMDMVKEQQLSFDNLEKIVPDEYAAHWQETLKFLKIITQYWPAILNDSGKIDDAERRNLLMQAQINLWQTLKPQKRIVIAGTTAAFPLMKEMVETVLDLPNGEIYLFGLDKYLSDEDWAKIDESHPQYELKLLLDCLRINRFDVTDFVPSGQSEKNNFVSEVMRPAETSDKWRYLAKDSFSSSVKEGLHFINCQNGRLEALAIALLMRETLTFPEKTAALVTTDRTLARRVSAELQRWGIEVDDSAGVPLSLTVAGIFLRQIISVAEQNMAPVATFALMKCPLFANGLSPFEARRQVRLFEKCFWRENDETADASIWQKTQESFEKLLSLFTHKSVPLAELLKTHLQVAEQLATTDCQAGASVLWKGEAGEGAARFMADVLEKADILGNIDPFEYRSWLEVMMGGITVRHRYGLHPRLKILGPIEARLQKFDRLIIGEVNENSWPQAVAADPWLSRPMKKDFGLPLPERAIGVQANDFSHLLSGKDVYLTRADRVQGTPMVKSRWLMRLETVLQALGINPQTLECQWYVKWAEALDEAEKVVPVLPAAPCPPVEARPRKLSASAVENLMRDPYIIYAKYILKLYPLNELEQEMTFADYGNIVHKVLQEFNTKYPCHYPSDAKEELLRIGEKEFARNKVAVVKKAFWWPSFMKTVDWLVATEQKYREDIAQVYNEVEGSYSFEAPAGPFTLTAKADRVDIRKDGKINIIDYKTGQARSLKEIERAYAPQLPIEAMIAQNGGFEGISASEVEAMIYWQLGKKESGVFAQAQKMMHDIRDKIIETISLFDFETTPYTSQPNPKYAPKYSDYEQLSRVNELTFGKEE